MKPTNNASDLIDTLELLPYQADFAANNSRFKIGLWARQTGKDHTATAEAVLYCMQNPTTWIIVAASERLALESFAKAKEWAASLQFEIARLGRSTSYKHFAVCLLRSSRRRVVSRWSIPIPRRLTNLFFWASSQNLWTPMNRINSLQTRVAIVDDHHIVSAALAELLGLDGRLKVVALPRTAAEAKETLARESVDVVLLDLELPDEHGLKLLPQVLDRAKFCILSMHTDAHFVGAAVAAGALGYVSKQASPEELLSAIDAVARGETFFSSDVRQAALLCNFTAQNKVLTPREEQVLRLAAGGASSSRIATELRISKRTAEAHRANILKKLALRSQTDLVRYALRHGIAHA